MNRALIALALPLSLSCADPTPPGFANVTGLVTIAGAAPLANSTVVISCASGVFGATAPTDAGGTYSVALEAPAAGRDFRCSFAAPTVAQVQASADTLVGFRRGGVDGPQQVVNLQAPLGP